MTASLIIVAVLFACFLAMGAWVLWDTRDRGEVAATPGFDEHADQALAISQLGPDFTEWEKELSTR